MLENRCRSIRNLLIAALSFWPVSQPDCPIGSWVKAVNSVITTWSDNLLAVLRTHSLLHTCCIAVAAFLIQPWVFRRVLSHLMGSRGRSITISAIECLSCSWPLYKILQFIFLWKTKLNAYAIGSVFPFLYFKLQQNSLPSWESLWLIYLRRPTSAFADFH